MVIFGSEQRKWTQNKLRICVGRLWIDKFLTIKKKQRKSDRLYYKLKGGQYTVFGNFYKNKIKKQNLLTWSEKTKEKNILYSRQRTMGKFKKITNSF